MNEDADAADDDELIRRDNERHRLEELERRAKRHRARDEKAAAATGDLGEKERKRREHAARILGAQQQQQQQRQGGSTSSASKKSKPAPPSRGSSSGGKHYPSSNAAAAAIASSSSGGGGGSSIFQSLFAERALGFSISFAFRNAPPRPPVGPIFVGLGLEGELQKWTNYEQQRQQQGGGVIINGNKQRTIMGGSSSVSGMNAVEKNYHWKLHSDLLLWNGTLHRQILPGCAMDYEGCYTATTTTATHSKSSSLEDSTGKMMIGKEGDGGSVNVVMVVGEGDGKGNTPYNNKTTTTTTTTVSLPPEDEALLNWKGSMGDTAMEILTTQQDRARAAARLAISQGKVASSSFSLGGIIGGGSGSGSATGIISGGTAGGGTITTTPGAFRLKKKNHLQSRILDEKIPNFMKKTTYLTNDTTSVHRFTSLASTQVQRAKDMDMAMKEKRENYNVREMIEKGFHEANTSTADMSTTSTSRNNKNNNNNNKRKRIHPISKQEVYALWDVPLLPDVLTWGHTFTHVVMDNPPRNVSSSTTTAGNTATTPKSTKKKQKKVGDSDSAEIPQQQLLLNKAIVADVARQDSNARMECTVWVPSTSSPTTKRNTTTSAVDADGSKSNTITTDTTTTAAAAAANTILYSAIQKYDLDVVPLRDPSLPPLHHVWTIYLNKKDEKKSYAGYHTIGSRVQLSVGRPVIVGGGGGSGDGMMGTTTSSSNAKIATTTTTSKVRRRNFNEREKKELEMKMTLVDVDLAEKYGL